MKKICSRTKTSEWFEAATVSFSEIESFKEIARKCSPLEVSKHFVITMIDQSSVFLLFSALQHAKCYL